MMISSYDYDPNIKARRVFEIRPRRMEKEKKKKQGGPSQRESSWTLTFTM